MFIIILLNLISIFSRSVHRPVHPNDPVLTVRNSKTGETYKMIDSRLQEYAFFNCYNKKHLEKNLLPDKVNYRYKPDESINGEVLNKKIENFLCELLSKKKKFQDFEILKCTDFNRKKKSGFIVVRFKDYPFVLKLSIETPKTITDFSLRGVQERAIFCMASSMRHLAGLTRVRTVEKIKENIDPTNPWYNKLSLPRKWYWLPKNPEYLLITANNLAGKQESYTKIPAIYGVICDEIKLSKKRPPAHECLDFCRKLDFILDPHTINFNYDDITGEITIIDTEYFPILMGAREKYHQAQNYVSWYLGLAGEFIVNKFCMLKSHRRNRQNRIGSYYNPYD